MFRMKRYLVVFLLPLLLFAVSCTNDSLDDGSGADVIMQILSLDNPAVTGQVAAGGGGGCSFTVGDWTANVGNAPKNELATPPFNDIVLTDVDIVYAWINPGLTTPPRNVGLGNVTIPALNSSQVTFQPIAFDDLSLAHAGSTANLTMTFRGFTVEGTSLTTTVLRQLSVESCD